MISKESALCTCLRKEFGIFSIGIASMYFYSQTSSRKPGSHMPPTYLRQSRRYCLGYCSDIWEHYAAGKKIYRRSLPPPCLRSWTRVNFAGMTAVKTGMISVAGDFCSHIGTVSQAVPATMSQVGLRHMTACEDEILVTFLHVRSISII